MKLVYQLSKNSQSFKIPSITSSLVKSKFNYMQTTGIIHTIKDYCLSRSNMDCLLLLSVLNGKGRLSYRDKNHEDMTPLKYRGSYRSEDSQYGR